MFNKMCIIITLFIFFKIQRQHEESVLFQVPGMVQLMFMVALRSCCVLDVKRINFGKAISLSVRYSRTLDNAEGSRSKI